MKIEVLTLFPEMFSPLDCGIIGSAKEKGLFSLRITDIRDYTLDKHKHVDDAPYGGGAGMVMSAQPIVSAVEAVDPNHECHRVYLSPRGRVFKQSVAREFYEKGNLLFLCGSYEGVDERAIQVCFDEELSIGDFVLTSGELAAMTVINCTLRYVNGVLGCADSLREESFSEGLLEYPQYTRPRVFRGLEVPEVLVCGDHKAVADWRREKSLELTEERRRDLLERD